MALGPAVVAIAAAMAAGLLLGPPPPPLRALGLGWAVGPRGETAGCGSKPHGLEVAVRA